MNSIYRRATSALVALALVSLALPTTRAITIDWVTVGNPGNTDDSTGFGGVADSFQIMQLEWTNSQYTEFLNAIDPDGTNPNAVYNTDMGTNARGGISFDSLASAGSKYSVKTDMGNKPVNYVNWFDAARVSNWLQNGALTYGSSDSTASAPQNTGAYTVGTAESGNAVALNMGATYWVPTENQWYKAAFFDPNHGGPSVPGYWDYATATDTAPTAVTADGVGNGSAGGIGNFANFDNTADWNSEDGNVTTVGTNGGSSIYDTFDMSGNVFEWNDLDRTDDTLRGIRGGSFSLDATFLSSNPSLRTDSPSTEVDILGFRLASPVPVPEPSTLVTAAAAVAWAGLRLRRRRRTP